MKVYEIIKEEGCGDIQCPTFYHPTGLIYKIKEDAMIEAHNLWIKNTTEDDRKSGWCYLHYTVRERDVL